MSIIHLLYGSTLYSVLITWLPVITLGFLSLFPIETTITLKIISPYNLQTLSTEMMKLINESAFIFSIKTG